MQNSFTLNLSFGFIILISSLVFFSCNNQSAELQGEEITLEKHRPHFHFTPPEKWMNDPNGMVFYEGEYHLFYQHYPDSNVWGPMHWGHAVSTDLVTWEHLPIALYPDSLGYIFSGSAVIDWKNTSGLGKEGQPPMIAIYTYHDPVGEKAGAIDFQYQGIAYSNDKGRTWTKYAGNPVIPNPGIRDFRDPKVIWDDDSEQWVMVFAAWDHIKIYGSKDLKSWNHLSDFGKEWGTHAGVWECPDLFPMTVEGTNDKKWVLLQSLNPGSPNGGSGTQYFVGQFDGKEFVLDEKFKESLGKTPKIVPPGVVFEDFENGYANWSVEGEAFGNEPAKGAFLNQSPVQGFEGARFVNSFAKGDAPHGKMTSKEFTIEKDFINFKIGGGNDKLRTNLCLIVDGKVARKSAGSNGEKLVWKGWDVKDLKGNKARFEINDTHSGGWGHINVDQITFADAKAHMEGEKAVWLDWGRDNYAGVTWADVPASDGRRIFMGWMSNWSYAQVVPTEEWRSAMTLPRELVLKNTDVGLRVISKPVKELEKLRTGGKIVHSGTDEFEISSTGEYVFEFEKGDIEIIFKNSKNESYSVGYQSGTNQFFSNRTNSGKHDFSPEFGEKIHFAPRFSDKEAIKLHLFLDVASCELFADDGSVVMTDIFFPSEEFSMVSINGTNVKTIKGEYFELK